MQNFEYNNKKEKRRPVVQDKKIEIEEREIILKETLEPQKLNIEKAKVKVGIEQFNDKLEFEDVNNAANREAKTIDQVIQDGTKQIVQQIANTNLGGS